MNTNCPKMRWLRTSQGEIHAAKMIAASMTPPSERLPSLARWYQTHNPETGRKESKAVLVSPATPHSKPNCSQDLGPSSASMVSVRKKITASSSAARLVSHTQRVHQKITDGSSAQVQAVHTATFSWKHLFAIRKIGTQVRAEKMLLMLSRTRSETRW